MYWFIQFPNEPNHPLHQTMIDFTTLIGIIRGDIKSQLSQMSKIHRMMIRYSVKKANRFMNRFPQVYWAPETDGQLPVLYYTKTNKYKDYIKENHNLLWWASTSVDGVVFRMSDSDQDKTFKVLVTGTEFLLYHDPKAGFDGRLWLRGKKEVRKTRLLSQGEENKRKYLKSNQLRVELGMGYHWRQEAYPYQVRWVKSFLNAACGRNFFIVPISNTQFEIRLNLKTIGMIAIMEFSLYLTLWSDEYTLSQIFGMSSEELKSEARKEKIEFYYTNSL